MVTYGEVDSESESVAAALAHLGVEAGDRVALVVTPRPEFVVTMFAVAKLGATIVPLNPKLTVPELQYALRHSGAVCLVTIEEAYDTDYLELFEELMPQLPDLQYIVTVGEQELKVIHCPGHTPGHVVFLYAPQKVAWVGDVLFQGRKAELAKNGSIATGDHNTDTDVPPQNGRSR